MSTTVPPSSRPPQAPSGGHGGQRALRLFRQGRLDEARACLEQTLALQPEDAELCNNLGVILAEQGRHEDALAYYERAVRLRPAYAHAHHNHGNALRRLGRLSQALASYAEAVRWNPEAADAYNNQGITLRDLGQAAEAAASFREALRRRPDHHEAHGNLGVALAEQGHFREAVAVYQQVLRRQPRSAEVHNNLGVSLAGQGQLREAIACYRRAVELKADYAEAYNNLGNALRQQGELSPAAAALQEALRLKPGYAEACNNLAIVQMKQGEPATALAAYDRALRWQPDYAEAHVNRALACLLQGDFAQGWPEYEWRWKLKDAVRRSFVQPRWDGSPLQGRRILLYAEQGLGDTLQFIRYALLVQQRGGVVLAELQPPLLPLLRSCPGIDQLLAAGEPLPAFDVQAPLLSLPGLLHTTLDNIPASVPYLSAEAERVARWGQEARSWKGFKVGIAWQGSPKYRDDRQRSIPLRHFAALAAVPGVQLLSLQKGFGREQLAAVASAWKVLDLGERVDEAGGAFVDTAAVMQHLDLVITSDTALAHLAGALGVPVWVVLPYACDWRWLRERQDSPWYPSMRLFRLQRWGDWDEVFHRVAHELNRQCPMDAAGPPPARSEQPQPCHDQAMTLSEQGRLEEAAEIYQQILLRHPQAAEVHNNLGVVRLNQGNLEAALAAYEEALRSKPDFPAARANRAWVWLLQGDYARGLPEYAHSCRSAVAARVFQQPRWQGEPLHGRTILLYAEHGLGDTLHLIRYATLVRQRGATVLAEVAPPLVPLLRCCPGIDQVVPAGAPLPAFDVQAPLLSLPGLCGTTLETVPADVPYLAAQADRIEHWGQQIRGLSGFKVGIVWQGNPHYGGDRQRSIPLKYFAALAAVPGVRLVSLQKGFGREQLAAVARDWNVLDLGEQLDASGGAFLDTAALLHHLDLVVSPDTAITHLAGALAVPVWLALSYAGHWLWLRERQDSPWYPTLRIFRQQRRDDWEEVFHRLAQALQQHVEAAARAPWTDAAALRKRGRELCQQGQHGEAIVCLRRAVHLAPQSAAGYNNLGAALTRQGQAAEALAACRQALRLRPHYAEAQHNLGEAFQQQGQWAEARVCYEEALRLKPGLAATHNSLGAVLAAQGELSAACRHYREAIRLQPDLAAAHRNLALALEQLGDGSAACRHPQQTLDRDRDSPAAYVRLGEERARQGRLAEAEASYRLELRQQPESVAAWAGLGRVLAQQSNLDEAIRCFEAALRPRAEDAELLQHLGDALRRLGRLPEAEACYRRALRVQPNSAYLLNHLGITLIEQSRPAEAESCFRDSLARQADHAPAHNNLGVALEQQGRVRAALAAYRESLRLDARCADTHKNLALAQLLSGDFEQGWPQYEWRWQCAKAGRRSFTQPRWDGRPLEGRTILLHAEQGLGDTLQFIRYAALVQQRGGVVLAEVQPPLLPLLRRCPGIDCLLPGGAPLPAHDVQAPLLSLPSLFHTTLATVPAPVPYLSADPVLVERWQSELGGLRGFKIGIAWQGSRKYAGDKHRSIPLRHFAALARVAGVQLLSLQKGFGREQLAAVASAWKVLDLGKRVDESGGAFVDTAAVMQHLDLVITSDTALAHLAGALGVPVWIVLPVARDWRWLLERDDSPWYPTMRLFRQQRWGDWDEVFQRVAAAVEARAAHAALRQPLVVEVAAGELLDKITILEIKRARLLDARQRQHVCLELGALQAARARALREPSELASVLHELKHVNECLWDVEDELRRHEQRQDFGPAFVQRARSVYQLNDRRAQLKRRLNVLCGSVLIEEKSYAGLAGGAAPAPVPNASEA